MKQPNDPETAETAQGWEEFLSRELGLAVSVRLGKARTTVLRSKKPGNGSLLLHMNSFFTGAPADVRESVVSWLRSGKRARNAVTRLQSWIDEKLGCLGPGKTRKFRIQIRGRHHDLEQIAAPLWLDFFPDSFTETTRPALTWGRIGRRRRRRSLRFGSYDERYNLVRVHPVLDQDFVPDWFVRYILFHELLHSDLGVQRNGRRRIVHGKEFRRREREYADYGRAVDWQKRNLPRLLASPGYGVPRTSARPWEKDRPNWAPRSASRT